MEADRATAVKAALDLCLYQISHQLAKAVQKVVVVAGPEAYPTWTHYVAAFSERGGVIEACASGASLCCPRPPLLFFFSLY